jgi:hypothetical protein
MKTAKSLVYGGELIDAIDCTYEDFKRLAPLCPNCSSPVHLKAGGDRLSTKGKPYKIPQHWAHFAGKSAEEVATCELRVNNYSDAEREKIQRVARGQREKWIRRWLWRIWEANVLSEYDTVQDYYYRNGLSEDYWESHREKTEQDYSRVDPLLADPSAVILSLQFDPVYTDNFDKMLKALRSKTIEDFRELPRGDCIPSEEKMRHLILKNNGQTLEEFDRSRLLFFAEITSEKNVNTAFEVSKYLCSKRSHRLISECFYSIYLGDLFTHTEIYGTEIKDQEGWQSSMSEISADEIMGRLLEIPWASEFARLEALEAAKATP